MPHPLRTAILALRSEYHITTSPRIEDAIRILEAAVRLEEQDGVVWRVLLEKPGVKYDVQYVEPESSAETFMNTSDPQPTPENIKISIVSEIASTQKEVEQLAELIDRLRDRLAPCLGPDGPTSATVINEKPRWEVGPMVESLWDLRGAVDTLKFKIHCLTERVEL